MINKISRKKIVKFFLISFGLGAFLSIFKAESSVKLLVFLSPTAIGIFVLSLIANFNVIRFRDIIIYSSAIVLGVTIAMLSFVVMNGYGVGTLILLVKRMIAFLVIALMAGIISRTWTEVRGLNR